MSQPKFFRLLIINLKNPLNKRKSVREILQGYPINQVDNLGRNILHWMPIWTSHEDSVFQQLINLGADVNHQSKNGDSPLHLAVYNGELGYVESLLRAGAQQNVINRAGVLPRDYLNYEEKEMRSLLNAYLPQF